MLSIKKVIRDVIDALVSLRFRSSSRQRMLAQSLATVATIVVLYHTTPFLFSIWKALTRENYVTTYVV